MQNGAILKLWVYRVYYGCSYYCGFSNNSLNSFDCQCFILNKHVSLLFGIYPLYEKCTEGAECTKVAININ